MRSLIARLFLSYDQKPVFAEDENPARAARIAELKWLLAEIAAPRPGQPGARQAV
jgi:hypothetical protein